MGNSGKETTDSSNRNAGNGTGKPKQAEAPAQPTNKDQDAAVSGCAIEPLSLSGWEWLLVFSPLIIFLVLFVGLQQFQLKKFSMDGALSENEYPRIAIPNVFFTPANFTLLTQSPYASSIAETLPTTVDISDHPFAAGMMKEVVNLMRPPAMPAAAATPAPTSAVPPRPSISRYIALLSTLLTLVIAVCLTCFYIYHYLRHGCAPNLSGFSAILLALGIGVLPYTVNKVSGAVKKTEA